VTFPDQEGIPALAYQVVEIPDEVIPVGNPALEFPPAVVFPVQVMVTGLALALVTQVGIPGLVFLVFSGLAFPAEAFPAKNVETGEVEFLLASRKVVNHKVAHQLVVVVRGEATVGVEH